MRWSRQTPAPRPEFVLPKRARPFILPPPRRQNERDSILADATCRWHVAPGFNALWACEAVARFKSASYAPKKNTTHRVVFFFGAVGGIRTLVPLLTTTRFPVVLVMTSSIPLHMQFAAKHSNDNYTKKMVFVNSVLRKKSQIFLTCFPCCHIV